MLYGAETWALTGKLEDILKSCGSRMWRCGLKMIQDKLRQRRLQWFGHVAHVRRETERGVLRLVEEMEVLGKRKVGRPRETWKDIVKRDWELIGVYESVALDRGRWRIIASPTPKTMMMMMMMIY